MIASGQAAAVTKRVVPSGPPSMQAKQPSSELIVCNTSPPSRTRTQRRPGTSANQTCTLGIYADAVRSGTIKLGPHATIGKTAIWRDVVRGQHAAVGLRHDQRRVVGRDCHAIREGKVLGNLASCPVRADEAMSPGANSPSGKSKPMLFTYVLPRPSDTMSFHGLRGEGSQFGVRAQCAVRRTDQQLVAGDDQQPPVGQPIEAERNRIDAGDHLVLAVEVYRHAPRQHPSRRR